MHTVLFLGAVATGPGSPRTDALAVRGGRVLALGREARALEATPGCEVLELGEGVLRPSFGDGHAHPTHGGVELLEAPVRDCSSVEEVLAAVARYAGEHRDTEWITGGSYDPTLAPGGHFEARALDAAVPDRPVVLTSADHHTLWVNSEALRRSGITAATPDPATGTIVRRADGSPMGTLVEWAAMDLVRSHLPPRSEGTEREGILAATRLMAAAGITWVQDAIAKPADVERCAALAAAGRLPVRMNLALRADPGRWREQRATFRDVRDDVAGSGSVRAGTVKLFADGIVEGGTAALLEPYTDAPHSCGLPVWPAGELAEAVRAFDSDGFQLHIHAIGDAGIRTALDAIAAAVAANGPRDRRPVLAHVQVPHPDDLPRFVDLGVIANFSPLWACLDDCQRELTLPRLGPDRGRTQYPMASLERAGARLSFGSDWPVSSLRPLDGLAVAVTRRTPEGNPAGGWVPEERLSPASALAAASSGVAYQAFEEHEWGSLAPGRRADLVHLGSDLAGLDPQDWPRVPVLGTWLAGTRTHASGPE